MTGKMFKGGLVDQLQGLDLHYDVDNGEDDMVAPTWFGKESKVEYVVDSLDLEQGHAADLVPDIGYCVKG